MHLDTKTHTYIQTHIRYTVHKDTKDIIINWKVNL